MHEDIYLEKGTDLLSSGRTSEALKEINKALSVNPDDPRAYLMRAKAYLKMGIEDDSSAYLSGAACP